MSLAFNCPQCGRPLTHLRSEGRWHFYECLKDGLFTLPAKGPMRPTQEADDHQAREDAKRIS